MDPWIPLARPTFMVTESFTVSSTDNARPRPAIEMGSERGCSGGRWASPPLQKSDQFPGLRDESTPLYLVNPY
jgi:hypothetical protein